MAFGLENLSDGQRKALLIGVPAVALVAVGVRFGKGQSAPPAATDATATATPPTGYIPTGSTDAIGVGQLSDFESKLTELFASVRNQPVPTTNPPPTTTTRPTLASLGLPGLGGFSIVLVAGGSKYMYFPGNAGEGPWLHSISQSEYDYATGTLHFQVRNVSSDYIAQVQAAL